MPIRLFTISHRVRTLESVRFILTLDSSLVIQGEARSVMDAVDQCVIHKPDVFIFDLDSTQPANFEQIARLRASVPQSHILVLPDPISTEGSRLILQAGADGLLAGDADPVDLLQTITALYAGKSVIPFALLMTLID